jgi:hypothetical protein
MTSQCIRFHSTGFCGYSLQGGGLWDDYVEAGKEYSPGLLEIDKTGGTYLKK